MPARFCYTVGCKVLLTEHNASPRRVRDGGHCRDCRKIQYHKTKGELRGFTIESQRKAAAAVLNRVASPELKEKLSIIHYKKYNESLAAGERRCARCGEVKLFPEFFSRTAPNTCKECTSNRQREHNLRNFFLITIEQADKISNYQNNVCGICGRPPQGKKRLSLDHRHSDGLIRGYLCNWCNRALGTFRDNIQRLRAAADYLENPPAIIALEGQHFARPGRIGTKKQRMDVKREQKAKKKLESLKKK